MSTAREDFQFPVASRDTVRRAIRHLVSRERGAVAGIIVLNCVAAALSLVPAWLVGMIADELRTGASVSTVDVLAIVMVVCAVGQLVAVRFARYAGSRFGERALATFREDFVNGVLDLPATVVERAGAGDLMTRSSQDVGNVGSTLRDALPEVFIALVRVVFVYGALFVLHPLLGLAGLVSLPPLLIATRWYLRRGRDAYLAEGAAHSDLVECLTATAAGARTVEALRLRPRRIAECDDRVRGLYRTRVRTLGLRSVLFPATDMAHALGMALMLLLGGVFLSVDWITLGAAISASLYMWQLVDPLDSLLAWVEQLQSSAASLARIKGVEEVATAAPPAEDRVPADDRIQVTGLRYAYGRDDVLHDVELAVRPGERLAIVGPSGSGKSTLGRLIAGIDPPRTGSVTVGGVEVSRLPVEQRRRRIVLVTQEHHVFLGTLRDNLAIAAPEADDAAMWTALDGVGADWARELPDGLDTELGSTAWAVDAAVAQQIALARVVLADPHTVILDEATAMLDPGTARRTERALSSVLDGRTVVAIAHRLHTAHDADRVAIMVDGNVAEIGTHEGLLARDGHYAALWRSWRGSAEPEPTTTAGRTP